jgi:hypothetical protein
VREDTTACLIEAVAVAMVVVEEVEVLVEGNPTKDNSHLNSKVSPDLVIFTSYRQSVIPRPVIHLALRLVRRLLC